MTGFGYCSLLTCVSLLRIYSMLRGETLSAHFTWRNVFKSLIARGKYLLFISDHDNLNQAEREQLEMTTTNVFIGICQGIMSYYSYMIRTCASGVCLMAVITLWTATIDFCTKSIRNTDSDLLQRNHTEQSARKDGEQCNFFIVRELHFSRKDTHFKYFLNSYIDLKTLAINLNKALGEVFLIYPIVTCFYYATELELVFTSKGWIDTVVTYYLLIQKLVTFVLAAEICRKVSVPREFLSDPYCTVLLIVNVF